MPPLTIGFNLLVTLHHLVLVFALGLCCLPRGNPFKEERCWIFVLAGLLGFNILSGVMAILGLLGLIHSEILYLILFFSWLIVFTFRGKVNYFLENEGSFSDKRKLKKTHLLFLIPIILIVVFMFISSFAPHTRSDEVTYHMYYTKMLSAHHGFEKFLGPLQMLFFMALQTYNAWSYALGAEVSASLNSFFFYIASLALLFYWAKKNFGLTAAFFTLLFAGTFTGKIATSITGGDNALNHFLIMTALIISYDLLVVDSRNNKKSNGVINLKIVTFVAVCCTSVIVKLSAIFCSLPLLSLVLVTLKQKKLISNKVILICAILFLVIWGPFFYKQYFLFGNPIFPLGLDFFGSGYFPINKLRDGYDLIRQNNVSIPRNLFNFIASPVVLGFYYGKISQPNILAWLLYVTGIFMLYKKKAWQITVVILITYTMGFFLLNDEYFRFYSGVLEFLLVLGVGYLFKESEIFKREKIRNTFCRCTFIVSYLLTFLIIIYLSQFVLFVISSGDKVEFLSRRVQCYSSIQWINSHLTDGDKVLTNLRERYYFDVGVETIDDLALSQKEAIVQSQSSFHDLLNKQGITHIFLVNPDSEKFLYEFATNRMYAKKIYGNEKETLLGRRLGKPIISSAGLYKVAKLSKNL